MIVLMVKDIIVIIVFMVIAFIFLFCGSLALDSGEEGKAIVLIMCSLYVAMYIHAGMIASLIKGRKERIEQQRDRWKSPLKQKGYYEKAGQKYG